jgi:hypothetical protein
MRSGHLVSALLEERNILKKKIASIEEEIAIIDKMIARRREGELNLEIEAPSVDERKQRRLVSPMKMTEAVQEVFRRNPQSELSAPEVRDSLLEMKFAGEFETKVENFLPNVHQCLKALVKKKVLKVRREQDINYYRKAT